MGVETEKLLKEKKKKVKKNVFVKFGEGENESEGLHV